MIKLSYDEFERAKKYILCNGRFLEKSRFENLFIQANEERVVHSISLYQNEDGGFGNALEPDFRLPDSSALATSVALSILTYYDHLPSAKRQIIRAIEYLERTYDDSIKGWADVPVEVNNYPHAPWWYREEPINYISGNPTAELLAYMIQYAQHVNTLNLEEIKKIHLERLVKMTDFEAHEIRCYLKLYDHLNQEERLLVQSLLQKAYHKLVSLNENEWDEYYPAPLSFFLSSQSNALEIPQEHIEKNLNYVIERIKKFGFNPPTWKWSSEKENFKKSWEVAEREWTGVLTYESLKMLKQFNRIEGVE